MALSKDLTTASLYLSFTLMLILQGASTAASEKDILELNVPPHARIKTNVTLECKYDVDDKELFSVKWFHEDKQIFTFKPNEDPPSWTTPSENLQIIESESSPKKIVLKEVDLSAAGNYSCEVRKEFPHFMTEQRSKILTVVVIPEEQPSIEGDVGGRYTVGDTVDLNCTAPPSIPAATLHWLINGEEAPEGYLQHYPVEMLEDGLQVANLGLNFRLSKEDFINGELKLKCTATIATYYARSDEHSQQDPTAAVKEVRERPSEGSLVKTGSATQPILGLPLLVILVCVNLLW